MEAKLQRRIQRYGWDLAAPDYEPLWHAQLAPAQSKMLDCAALGPGEDVVDIACGTGLVTFAAARSVGPSGRVLGVDISGQMVECARRRADVHHVANARFERMSAERLEIPDGSFDVALCALGLMYVPDPEEAVREMRRVVAPGGRVAIAVWGERSKCGWAPVFSIVDDEVSSEVCPLFFRLGQSTALASACAGAGLESVRLHRISTTLSYSDGDEACRAAFIGGPVTLAWSRFDDEVRERVWERYLEAISPWRSGRGYKLPGEFVVVEASVPG